jgi:hypothetical protein
MNATSLLVYPGPTKTHTYPCYVHRHGPYATLLGWATTKDIAEQAARDFEASPPVSTAELLSTATTEGEA